MMAAFIGGCGGTNSCKKGTVLLSVQLAGAAGGADGLRVTVTVDGVAGSVQSIARPVGAPNGTVEVIFSTYPVGRSVAISVEAVAQGTVLGSGASAPKTLVAGCDAITVDVGGGPLADMAKAPNDAAMALPDLSPPPDLSSPPADLSMHAWTLLKNTMSAGMPLRGIWGDGASLVFAVGDKGLVVRSKDHGNTWKALLNVGTSANLNAIWGVGKDVYVAGAAGTMVHSSDGGDNWSPITVGVSSDLFGIWGTGTGNLYVTTSSTILHWAFNIWGKETPVGGPVLLGIWGSSPTDIYAGSNQQAYHRSNGTSTWTQKSQTGMAGYVWGASKDDVFVSAAYNATGVYHLTSGGQNATFAKLPFVPQAIWGSGPKDVYVGGDADTDSLYLYRSIDGGTLWNSVKEFTILGTTHSVNAIWGTGPYDIFVADRAGGIFHYQ